MVFQLIYRSKSLPGIGAPVLEQIAYISSGRNEKIGISGILLHADNTIVQVLEGERYAVLDLYDKIQRDKRHYEVRLVAQKETDTRMFANIPMAFKVVSGPEINAVLNPPSSSAGVAPLAPRERRTRRRRYSDMSTLGFTGAGFSSGGSFL